MIQGKYYAIDAHCHVYPGKIADKAREATDHFYGYTSHHTGIVRDLLKTMDGSGIDHCVVQYVATSPERVALTNECIADEVTSSGGRCTGLGTLHQDTEDPKKEVAYIKELGLHGVKLHPDIQGFKIDEMRSMRLLAACAEADLPMLIHTGDRRYDNSNPDRVLHVLKEFPDLVIVGAHLGGWSIWEEAAEKLCGHPNFYVDTSSAVCFLKDEVSRHIILDQYGPEHVLFGTDYPMWDPKTEIEHFMSLGFPEEVNRKILCENAAKVFRLRVPEQSG